jgi:hypothetical protein
MKRRCGWLPGADATPVHVVWARNGLGVQVCPKSLISSESVAWLEEFAVWKRLGGLDPRQMPARTAEAFLILEEQFSQEVARTERTR